MKDDETVSLSVITFKDKELFFSYIPSLNILAHDESDLKSMEELKYLTRLYFKWSLETGFDSVKDYILSYDGWTIDGLGNLVEPGEEFMIEDNDLYAEMISSHDVKRWVLTINI